MMNTILETNAAVEAVRQAYDGKSDPDSQWVRGACPVCGQPLVSNCYYIPGKGYLILHQCWASLGENPTCDYQKVL